MSRPFKAAFFILFALICALPLPARAELQVRKLAEIKLIPEKTQVKPGDEIWIAIEQNILPGWHTYWKNPGDSGSAPRVTWLLPSGFSIGEIQWPAPHKMKIGGLVNYGYENNVILLQQLKIPDTLPAGPLELKVGFDVLVCREECIPEQGNYELILNGAEKANNGTFIKAALKKIPEPKNWDIGFEEIGEDFILSATPGELPKGDNIKTAEFFPDDWGVIINAAPPLIRLEEDLYSIAQKRDQRSLAALSEIKGLLAFGEEGARKSYYVTAKKRIAGPPPPPRIIEKKPGKAPAAPLDETPLLHALIFALLGGLILNLMPCVFPVLSIKALSLVKTAEKNPARARAHGLAYTAGVILSFIAIAALLVILRAGGAEIGWGFQLQNPIVVTLLAYLLFIIGLNLAGVFEISAGLGNFGASLAQRDGLQGSFFTGILATFVATPCTAPFMGVAVGAALLQPPVIALTIFAALGLGLAAPYLALSFAPALQKQLPKPGPWMIVFRQLLAFPMFASAAWLVWVVSQQAGPMGVFGALMGLVLVAFALWLLSHIPQSRYWRYKARILAVASFIFALVLLPAGQMEVMKDEQAPAAFGETWTQEKLDALLKGDAPIFVEMTAAWCITCKVNHTVAIDRISTRKLFNQRGIKYLIGDWTNQDAHITEYLNSFGRNGVPIYVFYGRRDKRTGERPEPRMLPQILTPGIVAEATE